MNGVFSIVFSLLGPGAGQVFNGQLAKGLIFMLLFALWRSFFLPLFLRVFARTDLRRGLKIIYVFNIIYMFIIAGAVIDAFYFSYSARGNFLFAFISVLCVRGAQRSTLNKNIFEMLCGSPLFFYYVKPPRKNNSPS